MALTEANASPQLYLRAQTRWRPAEIVFWLATLLPYVLFPNYLSLASQIAIAGLFALSLDLILGYAGIVSLGHAAFFGIGAYTAGLLSKYGWGEPLSGLAAAAAGRRHRRLRHELRHLPVSPSGADHAHAGLRLAARGTRQQRGLADRRHGRLAGHPYLEAARLFPFRSVRLHRLRLRARRAVRGVPVRAAAHSLAVRPVAARHPRKRRAHAGDRRAEPRAYPHHLYDRRRHRRDRRRGAGADHGDRFAGFARLRAFRRSGGDARARRRRTALRRPCRRRHLHGRPRSVLRHPAAILVFLDRGSAGRRGDAAARTASSAAWRS